MTILNDFSRIKFNGEGGITFLMHKFYFLGFYDRHEIFSLEVSYGFFSLTFKGHANQWCHTLPIASTDPFNKFVGESCHDFITNDCKALNKKYFKLRKSSDKSL